MSAFDSGLSKLFGRPHILDEFIGQYEPTAVGDTLPTDLGLVKTGIESEASDLNDAKAAIEGESATIATQSSNLGTQSTNLQTQIDALQAYITANAGSEEDLDPVKAALDVIKAAFDTIKANIDASVSIIDTQTGNLGTIKTNLDGLASDTQDIIDDYGDKPTDQDVVDALNKVKTDFLTAIQAGQTGFTARSQWHARCQGKGYYPKSQDTGDSTDADIRKLCPGCQAYGYISNTISDIPVNNFPNTDEYPDEIDQS